MSDKQLVAEHAASLIQDGMVVGLGTGSTANLFIEALARRQQQGLQISVVASSVVSAIKAQQASLSVLSIEQISQLDVYVDGADEVTIDLSLLKGRGYDLVREKLLANAANDFWVLIDASKQVNYLGQHFPIPVEVMPFAWQLVQAQLSKLGANSQLRKQGDGLWITSHGSLVLDAVFEKAIAPQSLSQLLNDIPGVVEHGIFTLRNTAVFCASNGQIEALSADKKLLLTVS